MKRTTKRDRGSGCVRQRKDGRWEGRVTLGVNSNPVYVYGKTKQDVIDKIRTEQAKPRADNEDKRLTVGEWLTRWLTIVESDVENGALSRSTFGVYSQKVKTYIKPNLGDLRLSKLTPKHIGGMLESLAKERRVKDASKPKRGQNLRKEKIGGRTLQVIHGVLRRALAVATMPQYGLIPMNPAAAVVKPKHKAKERVYLRSLEEIKAFVDATEESPLRTLFILGLDTGCRLGELLALQWADVDTKNGLLHIEHTLTRDNAGKLVATRPKTETSRRTVKLPASSVEALKDHHKASMDSTWVFHDDGLPLRRDGLVRSELKRIGEAIKKPGLSFHSLRHTSVSLLMSEGVDLRTIQTRVGHSTPRLTLALYSHSMIKAQDAAVIALDQVHRAVRNLENVSGQLSGQTDISEDDQKKQIPQSLAG